MKRQDDLFSERFTPIKVGFWHQPFHMLALIEGMAADEAEALRYEYTLVLAGYRDILGRPCLCGDKTVAFPAAVRGGRPGAHDSMGSTISLVADLSHAADQLPILWRETERIFAVQERTETWRRRARAVSAGQQPDLGRQHAWAWMAAELGWIGVCRWPRAEQAKVTLFTPRAAQSLAA